MNVGIFYQYSIAQKRVHRQSIKCKSPIKRTNSCFSLICLLVKDNINTISGTVLKSN